MEEWRFDEIAAVSIRTYVNLLFADLGVRLETFVNLLFASL